MRLLPEQSGKVRCLAFSPDGHWLAAGGTSETVRLWDARSWVFKQEVAFDRAETRSLAFHPDSTRLALGGTPPRSAGQENAIWLWNVASERVEQTLQCPPPRHPVFGLAFTPDGARLYACRQGDRWRIGGDMGYWRLSTSGAHFTRLQALGASAIAIAPDGTFVAEAKHGVSIERLRWFKRRHVVPLQPSPVNALAIRPDSKQVAAGHGKKVTLFAPPQADGRAIELAGHAGTLQSLTYSPDGATLSSGGKDGIVIFWDAATGSERLRLDLGVGPIHGVAFSPDGLVLAVAGDHGLVLIDVE